MVAAMLRDGASEKEILDGYPKLSSRMLELANLWAIAHPGRGRPRNSASEGYRLNARGEDPNRHCRRIEVQAGSTRGRVEAFSSTSVCMHRSLMWRSHMVTSHST